MSSTVLRARLTGWVGHPHVERATAALRERLLPRAGAAWAGVRRTTAVMTGGAWLLLVLVPVLWWAADRLAWVELRTVAWLFAGLLLLAVGFLVGRSRLSVVLEVPRNRVVVGERARGRVVLTNAAGRRSLPVLVELPVGPVSADFDLPSLPAGGEHEELFVVPTERRAVLVLGPVSSVRGDPLSLLRRVVRWTEPEDLFVHPRTVRLQGSAAGFIRDLEGETTKELSNSDVSFHALRAYVPGDDRRYVHWRTSARTGTLMVRQFEETRRSHLLVGLSTRGADYASDDEFELAVSAAASLGVQAMLDQATLTVVTSGGPLASPSPQRLLDQFSAVATTPRAPELPGFAQQLARDVWGASVAVLVCGSPVAAADLRRARRHFGPDIRTFVVRAAPGERTAVRTLGDVRVVTLGALGDLPGAIRRVH